VLGETEIGDPSSPLGVEQNILGFQISVQNSLLVGQGEGIQKLQPNLNHPS
jgi:hypothetical protein